jgi:hypothetical protein
MKIRVLVAVVFAVIMSGCVGTPDPEGWRSSQKSEFLKILETDKYMSICNQKALYEKVKQSKNSQLMSKLLIAYTENLANGCIVNTIGGYKQAVSSSDIKKQIKAGQSIENILKPYVPEYKQFNELIAKYRQLEDPVSKRKVRMNIERVKTLKPGLGKTYALVNIPEYIIRIIENDKESVNMRVVVGKRKNPTPIFSADLKYITLNPAWNVPDSIARNEIIPKTLRNPGYLKSHRLVIRKDYNLDSPALSFNSVNARAYVGGKGPVPFKFIEVPSSRNALGRVKFIFPNHHSVYMHDTPAKSLFKRKTRAFSHGCVRLHKPKDMLAFISKNYTAHSAADVQAKYNSKKTHYLKITKRLPVHTAYLTTYVDENGKLLSFGDPYGYDKSQQLNF